MGDNKRLDWVDQTRGFLFLLVIICHTRLASSWLQSFYNPIFLAGFFFLSGYLYKDKPIKEKITSIINGLVAPFVIYCLLWGGHQNSTNTLFSRWNNYGNRLFYGR